MKTNYDPIAEQYKLAKQQPWRTYIESYSLLKLVGDPTGLSVVDVACGEGYYTRRLRDLGAARVTGVDLSVGMIKLAEEQETNLRQGIEYVVGDARDLSCVGQRDLAVAAYLLNYAESRAALQQMCNALAACLRPGGRFVTVNSSAAIDFSTAPSYREYGFEIKIDMPIREGSPVTWEFYLDSGNISIENYYLNIAAHEAAFQAAGFREVNWHAPQLSPAADGQFDADYWAKFLRHPPIALIECIR